MSRSQALRNYIFVRLLLAPLMIWAIVTLVFLLLRATPGDPADAILGSRAPAEAKEALREQLGLNAPLLVQYLRYLGDLLHFDLGSSLASRGLAVTDVITQHFPATAELALGAIAIAIGIGGTLGAIAAARSGTAVELGGRLFGTVTYALPMFWAGMVMQLVFGVQLRWFPLGTRLPVGQTAPPQITGLYSIDSLLDRQFRAIFRGDTSSGAALLHLGPALERHLRANRAGKPKTNPPSRLRRSRAGAGHPRGANFARPCPEKRHDPRCHGDGFDLLVIARGRSFNGSDLLLARPRQPPLRSHLPPGLSNRARHYGLLRSHRCDGQHRDRYHQRLDRSTHSLLIAKYP